MALSAGYKLSHYEIIAQLGAGGMGVVYRARDHRLGRDLALKVLPAESMDDANARARLLREAQMASSLNHPHIAHIYEVGEDRDLLFIAMELVEGRPLREVIGQRGLDTETVLRLGLQIADALAYAHERGVIHRDLKSANVMITPEGRAKVLDFGLAKRLHEDDGDKTSPELSLTGSGMLVGTPNYLPPEILLGGKADPRSDVWAMGVVLYEMASGKLPFGGASLAELAGSIVNGAPTPMSGRVPVGLQAVIGRCLAKEPSRRYRHGSEIRVAIESLLGGTPSASAARSPRRLWIAAAAGLIVLGLGIGLAIGPGRLLDRMTGRAGGPKITSLAVLPLANLSGDPNQEFFADGMTEELITQLAPIQSLKVISRTSVMRYKNSKQPLREIADQLDVDGIIEGSVQRAGDRIRITAQLIEASTDHHLWAKSYERDFRDVLALQSEVAGDIAGEIRLQISPQESARLANRRPVNPKAYELYLQGRYLWNKMTPEDAPKAIDYYEKALALDPGDARYSSGLADAYVVLVQVMGAMPIKEGMAKVKEYARKALAADENSAEAHSSMACALFFGDWNVPEAERQVRTAIEINPGYGTAYLVYSVILASMGRLDEAMKQDQLAMQVDPMSMLSHWNAVSTLVMARRYDDAIALAKRAVELDPRSPLPQGGTAHILELRGEYEAALDIYDKFLPEDMGGKALVAKLRRAYAASGPKGYWRVIYDSRVGRPGVNAIQLAVACAYMGDIDRAMGYLNRAYDERLADLLWLHVEPSFDPLRSDPRFQELVRRVDLAKRT
jgi:eukaryotic-like serine/threonine-protein kinase